MKKIRKRYIVVTKHQEIFQNAVVENAVRVRQRSA